MANDRIWTCAHCGVDNRARTDPCRGCGIARGAPAGSPGLAALLSGLLPGLGQIYQDRWVRGALMLLVPALAVALIGALVLVADPITRAVVRNAGLAAMLLVGALFAYHAVVIADAFAGRLAHVPPLRRVLDYLMLAVVTMALVGVYGTVYRESAAWAGLLAKVFEPIGRVAPAVAELSPPPEWSGKERLNVLLLGVDKREGDAQTENTDTLIVLSLDPVNNTAAMLSIPRDTLVAIPGQRNLDKINAAYSYGGAQRGPDLARRTVEGLLNIPVHSFALIDFSSFTKIVDAFGGVLVDVKRPLRDEEYPTADSGIERLQLLVGPQLLSGDDALRYARSRHDSNDFSRSRRQQDVLAGLRIRLVQGGLARVPAIVDRVGTGVKTNFDPGNVLPLARTGSAIDSRAIRSEIMLPCNAPNATHCELTEEQSPLGYYLIPNKAKIADLVASLFYEPRVRQEGARVEVRATGARSATARSAAERLGARAFTIARTSEGATARSAVILRNPAKRYTADTLAKQLGLSVAEDSAETADADIVLRLGSDFRGFASDLVR